jgi:hypothetical protein
MLDFAQNRWDSAALEVKNLHINVIDELWCQRPEPRDPKSLHVHWLPFGSGANTCQYHPPETNVYWSCDMLLHATESRKLIHFEHVGTFFWLKLRSSSLVLCRAPTKQDQGSRAQFQECLKFQEDSISRSVCKVTRHEMLGHVWHVISGMLIYTFIYIACEAQIRRKFHRFQSPITPLCESTLAFQVAMLYQRLISNLLCLFKKNGSACVSSALQYVLLGTTVLPGTTKRAQWHVQQGKPLHFKLVKFPHRRFDTDNVLKISQVLSTWQSTSTYHLSLPTASQAQLVPVHPVA